MKVSASPRFGCVLVHARRSRRPRVRGGRRASLTMALAMLYAWAASAAGPAESYYDTGDFHYEVTTNSLQAQTWFDRGLAMCIAFNHEEGVRCFEKAVTLDPGMAMGYWGMAYAWGPNINNTEIEPHQIAKADLAARLAKLHAPRVTPRERALIDALALRTAVPVPEDREPLNAGYAEAMRSVHEAYPTDVTIAAFFAESLMILNPWKQWDAAGNPAPSTAEIVKVLEGALEQSPAHPALCHFYIHAMEASPWPERALPAANQLRNAMPGAGHLVHMPSHIDVLLGDYQNVIRANQQAIRMDQAFLEKEGPYNFYTFYRIHNYHFLVYGAMFDGQRELALRTARVLQQQIPEPLLKSQTDFLDAFMPMPFHVLVRFGDWEQILTEPAPADYLPVSRAVRHYARALAFAATNRLTEAETEQSAFLLVKATVPETSALFNNSSQAILGVAEKMVAGEIAYRQGRRDEAFALLREAVRRDDAMNYDEPWGWMQPARHALGALLLEAGETNEAREVYQADLKRHPHNPWALHGLWECLMAERQLAEAAAVRRQFEAATRRADVKIDRSCYCRLNL